MAWHRGVPSEAWGSNHRENLIFRTWCSAKCPYKRLLKIRKPWKTEQQTTAWSEVRLSSYIILEQKRLFIPTILGTRKPNEGKLNYSDHPVTGRVRAGEPNIKSPIPQGAGLFSRSAWNHGHLLSSCFKKSAPAL